MQTEGPAAEGTRSQQADQPTRRMLIEVARREISEHGFNGVSLRSIARRAEVDPSLVRHYFGSKQNLLTHAVQLDLDAHELAEEVLRGSPGAVGRRVVKALLAYWDNPRTAPMTLARVSGSLNSEEIAQLTRDDLIDALLVTVAEKVSPDHPKLRAALVASQLIPLALNRYLVSDPVLAACTQQDLVRIFGRTAQRYLTEPLPVDATGRDAVTGAQRGQPHRSRRPASRSPRPPQA